MQAQPKVYASIAVIDPILQKAPTETIPPYVTYLIAGGDPHGPFEIRRRFREFLLLRNKLVERFIGIYIPPISSKRQAVLRYSDRARLTKNMWRKGGAFCNTFASRSQRDPSSLTLTSFRPSSGEIPTSKG